MKVKAAKERGKVRPKDPALVSEESVLRIQKILVPTDFSDASKKALRSALSFARQFHAKVFVLHVVEIPYGIGEAVVVAYDGLIERMRREAERQLARLLAEINVKEVPAQMLLRSGVAYHEIVEAAKELQIDLIIIATRGHIGLAHLFLGSTAERVVRHAPGPVLVVREKEHHRFAKKSARAVAVSQKGKRTSQQPILAPIEAL